MLNDLPTPIPVGSPHVVDPPIFDRWKLGTSRINRLEKRDYERRHIQCELWMIDSESNSVLRCRTNNISDAGLYGSAPIGFGLGIGQRYELRLAVPEDGGAMSSNIAKSLGYATVIRTEMDVGGARPDRVGFAVRFDVPQLMPA